MECRKDSICRLTGRLGSDSPDDLFSHYQDGIVSCWMGYPGG